MDYLKITGPVSLRGEVNISGAKNAALPLIAMTILSQKGVTIENVPHVRDIKTLLKLLEHLGANYEISEKSLHVKVAKIIHTKATYDIVKTMRASILVLGPLLAREGHCEVSLPGGCAIGQRPIDLHLKALEMMGAKITIQGGYVYAEAKEGLKGAHIIFDKITVTGTANIVMAAALAHGKTTITNAAKEPEVVQLCEVIKASGVSIDGIGTSELTIYGTSGNLLEFKPFRIIPDRIEAGTYLCAAAITKSEITLTDADATHMDAVIAKLGEMGFRFTVQSDTITIHPTDTVLPVDIVTREYPAFPTDMQAQFLALATQAEGTSTIQERLFENRFMHVSELQRLGADIKLSGNVATITGGKELYGADVMATDLRASSALVLAALVARGESSIHRIYHLDRGYERLEAKLRALGAKIERLSE